MTIQDIAIIFREKSLEEHVNADKITVRAGAEYQTAIHLAKERDLYSLIYVQVTITGMGTGTESRTYVPGNSARHWIATMPKFSLFSATLLHETSIGLRDALRTASTTEGKFIWGIHLVVSGITREKFDQAYGWNNQGHMMDDILHTCVDLHEKWTEEQELKDSYKVKFAKKTHSTPKRKEMIVFLVFFGGLLVGGLVEYFIFYRDGEGHRPLPVGIGGFDGAGFTTLFIAMIIWFGALALKSKKDEPYTPGATWKTKHMTEEQRIEHHKQLDKIYGHKKP